jgi:hypothetical protein
LAIVPQAVNPRKEWEEWLVKVNKFYQKLQTSEAAKTHDVTADSALHDTVVETVEGPHREPQVHKDDETNDQGDPLSTLTSSFSEHTSQVRDKIGPVIPLLQNTPGGAAVVDFQEANSEVVSQKWSHNNMVDMLVPSSIPLPPPTAQVPSKPCPAAPISWEKPVVPMCRQLHDHATSCYSPPNSQPPPRFRSPPRRWLPNRYKQIPSLFPPNKHDPLPRPRSWPRYYFPHKRRPAKQAPGRGRPINAHAIKSCRSRKFPLDRGRRSKTHQHQQRAYCLRAARKTTLAHTPADRYQWVKRRRSEEGEV